MNCLVFTVRGYVLMEYLSVYKHYNKQGLLTVTSTIYTHMRGPGISVGIATELRAGRSGIESRWGRDFPPIQAGPEAHPAPVKRVMSLSRGKV